MSRPNTDTNNAADGACAANGTTGFDGKLAGPAPAAFVAVTRTVYAMFAHTLNSFAAVSVPGAVVGAGAWQPAGTVCLDIAVAANAYEVTRSLTDAGVHDTAMPRPAPDTLTTTG